MVFLFLLKLLTILYYTKDLYTFVSFCQQKLFSFRWNIIFYLMESKLRRVRGSIYEIWLVRWNLTQKLNQRGDKEVQWDMINNLEVCHAERSIVTVSPWTTIKVNWVQKIYRTVWCFGHASAQMLWEYKIILFVLRRLIKLLEVNYKYVMANERMM